MKPIEKGVYFGNIHSYHDLNLILAPFVPAPAKPKTNYVDIPGGDGSVDLTEAHGEVKFEDRDFEFTFSVNPTDKMSFDEKVTQVSNTLNGKKCKITLDRDSDFYWEGRVTVDKYAQNKRLKQVSIKARVKPYKLKQDETKVIVSVGQEAVITNGRKSVIPSIMCTNDNITIELDGNTFVLNAGTHKVLDFCLTEGSHIVKVSGGAGVAIITYQEGEL